MRQRPTPEQWTFQRQAYVSKNTSLRSDSTRSRTDRVRVLQHRRVLKEGCGSRDIPAFEPVCRRQEKVRLTPRRVLEEIQADKTVYLTQSLA
jgi:hypothetical protein